MRFLQVLILLTLLMIIPSTSLTQAIFLPELEPISATNLEEIEQLAMFHRGTIEEMAWSPDSQYLAVGGSAGGWIYSAENLQAEPIHFAQFMSVNDLDFHPDGNHIISTGNDGAVYEWDATTGNLIREIAPEEYNECPFCKAYIYTVKYSPNGRYIAIGSSNANTLLLDSSNLNVLASIPENSYELFFSPNGLYMAAKDAVSGNQTHIWLLESLLGGETEVFYTIEGLPIEIWNIAWTADSENLLLADMIGEQLYRYNLETKSFSEFGTGSPVVTANSDFVAITYREYDTHSQKLLRFLHLIEPGSGYMLHQFEIFMKVTDLRFSPNGQYLAVSAPDGSIQLWEMSQYSLVERVTGTGAMVTALDLLTDNYLLSVETEMYAVNTRADGGGCGNNTLRLWNLGSGTEINHWPSYDTDFPNFVCGVLGRLPNSQQVLLQEDKSIIVLNPFTEEFFQLEMPFVNENYGSIFHFRLSNDGSRLAVLASNHYIEDEIFIWDVSDGLNPQSQAMQTIVPYSDSIHDLVFSPNSLELIIAFDTGELSRWEIETGELISLIDWKIPQWFNMIQLAMSSDASRLVINANGIQFLETINYTTVDTWDDAEDGTGEEILYGRSNDWFVTRAYYNKFRFWISDADNSYYLPVRAEHIAFSENGEYFVTGGNDGTIRIWGVPVQG